MKLQCKLALLCAGSVLVTALLPLGSAGLASGNGKQGVALSSVTDQVYGSNGSNKAPYSPAADASVSRLLMFKEGALPSGLHDILEAWPDVEADPISEIGMLRLRGYAASVREAEQQIRDLFGGSIEQAGEDPKLVDNLGGSERFQLQGQVQLDTSSSLQLERKSKVSKRGQSGSVGDQAGENLTVNAELYQTWGWDIQEVTNNGQSFAVQPGSHDVVVAVIDSGIDASHPDLIENIVSIGKSFVPGVNDTIDRLGHGTMMAGAIAANGRLLGVGPKLGLVPYKVFDQGEADSSWVIEAIIQAVRDDADVINLSLGTYKSLIKPEDQAVLLGYMRALTYAYLKGVVVVASSGTDGLDISNPLELAKSLGWENDLAIHAPGSLPGVITVSATNREHERAFYSNYGLYNMLAAPAGDYGSTWFTLGQLNLLSMCLTTYPTTLPQSYLSQLVGLPKGYEFMIGTSLAAPKVSAAAALLIAEGEKRGIRTSPDQIKRILFRSATDYGNPGPDQDFGAGVVNVSRSLEMLSR